MTDLNANLVKTHQLSPTEATLKKALFEANLVIKIVKVDATEPIKKAQRVVKGIPFSILSLNAKTPKDTKITGVKFAIVVPRPVKKLCVKKPNEYCFSGNLSEIKALYGSKAILFAASKIQSKLAAIHNEFE